MDRIQILIIDDNPNNEINNIIIPDFIENTFLKDIVKIYQKTSIRDAEESLIAGKFKFLDFIFLDQMFPKELGSEDYDTAIEMILPLVIKNYPDCRVILLSKNGQNNIRPYNYFCRNRYYLPCPSKRGDFAFSKEFLNYEFKIWNRRQINYLTLDEFSNLKNSLFENDNNFKISVNGRTFSLQTFFGHLLTKKGLANRDIIDYLLEITSISIDGWDKVNSKISEAPLKNYAKECFTNPEWHVQLVNSENEVIEFIKSYILLKHGKLRENVSKYYRQKLNESQIEWGFTYVLKDIAQNTRVAMSDFLGRMRLRRVVAIFYLLFDLDPCEIYHILKWKIPDFQIDDSITKRTYQNVIRYNLFLPLKGWDTENPIKRKNSYYRIYQELLFHEDRLLIKKIYEEFLQTEISESIMDSLQANAERLHLT